MRELNKLEQERCNAEFEARTKESDARKLQTPCQRLEADLRAELSRRNHSGEKGEMKKGPLRTRAIPTPVSQSVRNRSPFTLRNENSVPPGKFVLSFALSPALFYMGHPEGLSTPLSIRSIPVNPR